MTTPILIRRAPRRLDVHGEVLDHRVGQQRLGHLVDLGEPLVGELAVDLELEPLALADVGHAVEAEPGQRAEDGLALRVEDLGLGHDVDDDAGHGLARSRSPQRHAGVARAAVDHDRHAADDRQARRRAGR